FIAAIAYVDPGNFATNIAAGSKYGYMLLWVILVSNLMAMLIQTMSAKLGIATGVNLAEVSREAFSKPMRIFLWLQAEAVAMACDLAEFVGAALGFHLLFGMPLLPARLLTGRVGHARAPRRPAHRCCHVPDPQRRVARRAPPRSGHHDPRGHHRGGLHVPD